jgi:hypothetical protein
MRSASYRFDVANVPKIATVAVAHCPKRPWTLDFERRLRFFDFGFCFPAHHPFSARRGFSCVQRVLFSDLDSAYRMSAKSPSVK